VAGVVVGVLSPSLRAFQKPDPAAPNRIKVCELLPKEEVKKHLPWEPMFDRMKLEEEAIGVEGSSCGYPSVHVQVLPYGQSFLDAAKKRGGLEHVAGVGDEAYFHNNKNLFAELYVRIDKRILTLQASVPSDGKAETVKPALVSLAKAYVPKLR
jgi:hypothetical protein